MGEWMTVGDIARETTLSRVSIYRLIYSGRFPPCFRPMGPSGHPRWLRKQIEEWKAKVAHADAQPEDGDPLAGD